MTEIASLVLFAADVDKTAECYRAPARRVAGSSFPGFYVQALDDVTQSLRSMGATVLTEHEQMPWGCRVIAEDPDGRATEVNDRAHCPR